MININDLSGVSDTAKIGVLFSTVADEIDKIETCISKIKTDLDKISKDVHTLQIKAAMVGVFAGLTGGAISLLITYFTNK